MKILKLAVKNAFRHKLRTGLTILGLAVAVMAFGLLRTVIDAWYAGAEAAPPDRLIARNAVNIIFPLPLSYRDQIAKVPGVTALFAASGDLGNFTGYRQGTPDYERAINIVHDATLKAGVRLCGPLAWRDRPDFTCFQAGSETAAIARGVAAELGPLTNTQAKPEVGPFAKD